MASPMLNHFGRALSNLIKFIGARVVKVIKRVLWALVALIVIAVGIVISYANSERLAYDIAHLSCVVSDANGLTSDDARILPKVRERYPGRSYARLQKDWLQGAVLLNWVDTRNAYEQGLQPTHRLKIEVDNYTGRDWSTNVTRSIDRETLRYRVEFTDKNYWVESNCVLVPKARFEDVRQKSAAETKAKQKI